METVGVRLKDTEVATLDQKLKQSGFNTLGDLVRAYNEGLLTNGHLLEPLADAISAGVVNKLLTSADAPLANLNLKESHGWDSIPRPPAYKAGALPG